MSADASNRWLVATGYYFRENFHGSVCRFDNWLASYFYDFHEHSEVELERADFLHFVDTVEIECINERLQYCLRTDLLASLTTLRWCLIVPSEKDLHLFANTRNNIETIELYGCIVEDCFIGQLLASCPNLKRLRIVDYKDRAANSILHRAYPMLTDFQYISGDEQIDLLTSFLEQNPSLKTFRIESHALRYITFSATAIHLDCVCVNIDGLVRAVELANLLKALHANHHYKTLHVAYAHAISYFDYLTFTNEMVSFQAFEALVTSTINANICNLIYLKELHILNADDDLDLNAIAVNLINLERLRINCTVEQFLPFLRYSKKLKMIIFAKRDGIALNLFKLNDARRMSGVQRKIQIGLYEDSYLATKWMAKNLNYNNLVEITRTATIKNQFRFNDND